MRDYEEGGGDSFDDAPVLSSEVDKRRAPPAAPAPAPAGAGLADDEDDNALESLAAEREYWPTGEAALEGGSKLVGL